MPLVNGPLDWNNLRLIVFDLDGTLYNQRILRAHMLLQIARASIGKMSLRIPRTLRIFRNCREELGDKECHDFKISQYELTARQLGLSSEEIRTIICEWIEARPLSFISRCTYPGVREIFDALKASKTTVAILSDYPARQKLSALGLHADHVVSAVDDDVGYLKPHPAGLRKVLRLAAARAEHSLMIGDRFDRDWEVAQRVGMRALIRSRQLHASADTFQSFTDDIFKPLIQKDR